MPLSKIQGIEGQVTPNLGRRNLIINGNMAIWQRGTSTTTLTANDSAGYNGADRFGQFFDINDGSGTISLAISQSTDTPASEPFDYSIKAVVTDTSFTPAGSDNVAPFTYKVETYDANPLGWGTAAAKPATLSYWIKSSVAGTGTLQIRLTDSSTVSGASDGNFYTTFVINTANTWEKKTHLIPANTTDGWSRTTSTTALHIHWNFGSNQGNVATEDAWFRLNNHMQPHSSQTLNFLNGGGTAYLTGVQLEVGDTATPFEHRPYGEELALCQRYCYQHMEASGGTGSGNSTEDIVCTASCYNSATAYGIIQMPVTMRVAPTLDSHGGTNYWKFYNNGGVGTFNTFTIINATRTSVQIYNGQSIGLTAGQSGNFQGGNTGNYIRFIAEL